VTKIMPIALNITGNEKAVGLTETNYKTPNRRAVHRYQCIYVIRDGKVAEFQFDMGPVSKYKGINLINIPSFLEMTVDELRDLADELRGQSQIDVKDLLEINRMRYNV